MDYLKNAFFHIWRKKGRAFLTILGISIGVMSVVLISMIGDVGKYTIQSELSSMGIDGVMVSIKKDQQKLTMGSQELKLLQQEEGVIKATPFMTSYSNIRMRQEDSKSLIWGIDQDSSDIISLEIVHGRAITKADVLSMAKVCVVDESFAKANYHRSNIVGKKLSVSFDGRYETFTVIGVAKSGGNILQGLMGDVVPCFTYLPYSTMQQMSLQSGFDKVVMKLNDNIDRKELENDIIETMASSFGVEDAVEIEDLNQQMDQLNDILNIVTAILTVIAGISLLVAGLSIMTVMLVSVSERTKEIGIKKSIGATRGIILMEFMTESFLLTLIGAAAGVLVGVGLGTAGCLFLGIHVIINTKTILWSVIFAVVVGVLFGVYPAWKASRLSPVEALRCE